MRRSESSSMVAFGTVHYYANLPDELKHHFRPHQHSPVSHARGLTAPRGGNCMRALAGLAPPRGSPQGQDDRSGGRRVVPWLSAAAPGTAGAGERARTWPTTWRRMRENHASRRTPAKPPNATSKPPQGLLIARRLRLQSHPKAPTKRQQGSHKASSVGPLSSARARPKEKSRFPAWDMPHIPARLSRRKRRRVFASRCQRAS